MSLTFGKGPLGTAPHSSVNYAIEGPKHRLLLEPFPRRVRGRVAGELLVDTREAQLLHESNILPRLYVPADHLNHDLLEETEHSTHCPFKGDAAYWTIRAGGAVRENQIWHYPEPKPEAPWLEGLAGFYWEAADTWLDEDEEVPTPLRDPYHRVDVRRSSLPVTVKVGEEVIAQASSSMLLSETTVPNRFYLERDEITATLEPSDTRTLCPYKGEAEFFHVNGVEDAAWSYAEMPKIEGRIAFDPEKVELRTG